MLIVVEYNQVLFKKLERKSEINVRDITESWQLGNVWGRKVVSS